MCCTTQSKWLVQAQPEHKYFVRTTKPITLPPFSTSTIKGSTKLRSHGMRLNPSLQNLLIAHNYHTVCNVPITTYCILEPGSNRVAVGLKNVSAKAITRPSQTVVGKLQQARMVPNDKASKLQDKQGPTGGRGAPGF